MKDFKYLFLEQWHRLEELPHFPEPKVSELHFLFKEEESGGLPTDETWDKFVIWKVPAGDEDDGCLLSISPPVSEEINELAATEEEYEKFRVLDESLKGRWRLIGGICCKGVALKIVDSEILDFFCWVCWIGWFCGDWGKGALLKRACPVLVLSRSEITRLNLETATSATALQSLSISNEGLLGFEGEKEDEDEGDWYLWRASDSNLMSFSTLSKPEAASWTAFSSALAVKLSVL